MKPWVTWLIGVITAALAIPLVGWLGLHLVEVMKSPVKIEKYEDAYVKVTEFVEKQHTANEINQEKWTQQKIEDDRQWQALMQVMNDDNP